MRESNGRPRAFNGNKSTGDHSYGVFQINMIGQLGADRRAKYGLSSNEDLFDPVTNAQIVFKMTAGGENWGSWNLGPNAYKGGNSPAYERWYREYPYQSSGMDDFKQPSIIENALAEMGKIAFPSPAILTGYVVISTWSDGAENWMVSFGDDSSPTWVHKGMIQHASDTWNTYDDFNAEDEDE